MNLSQGFAKRRILKDVANQPLAQLVRLVERGDVDLSPPYQRGLVWDLERKVRLIDSLAYGISMPAIYFRDLGVAGDVWLEVVDGKQRLSTLAEFARGEFAFAGRTFPELGERERAAFLMIGIATITVKSMSDADTRELYECLNFCGVPHERRKA